MVEKNLIKAFVAVLLIVVIYNISLWLLSESLYAVNIKGLVKLCNNFDRVIITNSYCDYGYKPSNNNLTVIDVCG